MRHTTRAGAVSVVPGDSRAASPSTVTAARVYIYAPVQKQPTLNDVVQTGQLLCDGLAEDRWLGPTYLGPRIPAQSVE